ncbi:hypothetical protein [Epilithonimonas sp. UC225_85]|uniref:hypothetical protein n=1 Tax=Epilithonimonas sp. UC225_85 TaxID=3350167 RepID=UPI0036D33939
MKKSVILLASAILVVSCDIPAGGNKGRLKKTDEIVRYDDPNAPHGTYKPTADTAKAVHTIADTAKATSMESKATAPSATEAPKAEH